MQQLAPRAGYCEAPEANFGLESLPWRWECGPGSGAGSPARRERQNAREPKIRSPGAPPAAVFRAEVPTGRSPLGC